MTHRPPRPLRPSRPSASSRPPGPGRQPAPKRRERRARTPVRGELQRLRAANALYARAVAHLPLGLSAFDDQHRLLLANQRYLDIWALPPALGVPGTALSEIVARTQGHEVPLQDGPQAGDDPMTRRREWRLDNGRHVEVTVTRLDGGAFVAVHEDISERRQAQERLRHQARHDPLTQLPNRAVLLEALERCLTQVQRDGELAVMWLDLDHFKAVNDTLGHAAGDTLLRDAAKRLGNCLRSGDMLARLGGDEFAVMQLGGPQPTSAAALGRRLVEALREPFLIDGQRVHVGTSVGIAVAPFDGADANTLLKHADLALYRAKADGRGTTRFFEPEMDRRMQERRQLEADLRQALQRGEFELAYQPQVAVPGNVLTGVEALIRWRHPTRGTIAPSEFIPMAEDNGMIVPIGRWVLQQACRDALRWPAHVPVAVNVSPAQFRDRSLAHDVMAALADAGLAPGRLEIEITEAVLMHDTERALAVMHGLRAQGVRVSLDDFGTGHSSLSYLRRFPFDKLKIDRSFVVGVDTSSSAAAIVRSIVSLGDSLGMSTIAEGVETDAQLSSMLQQGCRAVQGFLYSRPCPAADIARLLAPGALPAPTATRRPVPPEEPPCTNA